MGRGRREREMDRVGRRLFSQNKDVEKGADKADTSLTGMSYHAQTSGLSIKKTRGL